MRGRMWVPIFVFAAGVACVVAAAATGEAKVELFIIFPLISGTGWLFVLGVVLIVASFVLGFILAASAMTEAEEVPLVREPQGPTEGKGGRTRYGGVILIGPVPIIFGSDRGVALIMLVLAIILIAVVLAIAFLKV